MPHERSTQARTPLYFKRTGQLPQSRFSLLSNQRPPQTSVVTHLTDYQSLHFISCDSHLDTDGTPHPLTHPRRNCRSELQQPRNLHPPALVWKSARCVTPASDFLSASEIVKLCTAIEKSTRDSFNVIQFMADGCARIKNHPLLTCIAQDYRHGTQIAFQQGNGHHLPRLRQTR